MNAKEAIEVLKEPRYESGHYACDKCVSTGFLEATKVAEPLLVVIIKLYQALNQFTEPCVEQTCEHGKLKKEADLNIGKESLASAAQVVEKYKKEVLGEI